MRHISLTENEICKKTMTYGRKSYEKQKTLLGIRFNSMYAASVMAGCGSGGGSDSKGSSEGNTDKGTEADAGGTSSDKEVKLTMLAGRSTSRQVWRHWQRLITNSTQM